MVATFPEVEQRTCAVCPLVARNEDGTVRDLGRDRCVCSRTGEVARLHWQATQECEWAIAAEDGDREPEQVVVDELAYRSYKFQRLNSPAIEAHRWSILFPNWEAMENRYQDEQAIAQREFEQYIEAQAVEVVAPLPTDSVEENFVIDDRDDHYLIWTGKRYVGRFYSTARGWMIDSPIRRYDRSFSDAQDAQRALIKLWQKSERVAEIERAAAMAI